MIQSWCKQVPALADGTFEDLLGKARKIGPGAVFPPPGQELRALELTPFSRVRVVILGQDPYHGPGQANGLAFSVPEGVRTPPSLRNIFKEIDASCGEVRQQEHSTDLTSWAKQGVLLLNSFLTVAEGKAGAHAKLGWEQITDSILSALSEKRNHVCFLLWGNFARSKSCLLDAHKHLILEAAHPSPLSAHRGFLGCKHFIKVNQYLVEHGTSPIVW